MIDGMFIENPGGGLTPGGGGGMIPGPNENIKLAHSGEYSTLSWMCEYTFDAGNKKPNIYTASTPRTEPTVESRNDGPPMRIMSCLCYS